MSQPLHKLALEDGRFSPEAYRFLFEALETVVQDLGRESAEGVARHVSGQELLTGLKRRATRQFGPLAAQVWRSWGIRESLDWGRMVFLLVDKQMLRRQDGDSLEDFREDFDFDDYFVQGYELELPPEIAPPALSGDD
jgi:uncharacterized repeat protein (TIGR04138 family)